MKYNQYAITCISWGCKWTWGGNNRKEPKPKTLNNVISCFVTRVVQINTAKRKQENHFTFNCNENAIVNGAVGHFCVNDCNSATILQKRSEI